MKKVLILTVGTGTRPDTDIVRPLVKTIRHSRPDFLASVVSALSRKYAEEIARQLAPWRNTSRTRTSSFNSLSAHARY